MADAFPDTPVAGPVVTLGWSQRAPTFFPDSPAPSSGTGAGGSSAHGSTSQSHRTHSVTSAPPDVDSSTDGRRRRRDYDRDAALEVRSGRMDTLGWVSASWEPRCVTLRADGTLSVRPLGKGRKTTVQQPQQHQREKQQREQQRAQSGASFSNFVSNASNNSTSSTSQQIWSPLMKKLSGRASGTGSSDRGSGATSRRPPSGSGSNGGFGGTGTGRGNGGHIGGKRLSSRLLKGVNHPQRPRIAAADNSLSEDEILAALEGGGGDVEDSRSVSTSVGSHFDSAASDLQVTCVDAEWRSSCMLF